MKKLALATSVAITALFCTILAAGAEELTKVRIGWQIPWATQGQLVQILKHTEILKENGLEGEFVGRTYGPELNEVALAGGVDVVLTADQPAAILFSKEKGWAGIGRLMYNRTLTYVPPKSEINSIAELKGKSIGIPIGAAAERMTVAALKKAGLNPATDVKIVNLGILEQGPLVLGGANSTRWDAFDALSGFDPTPAIFEAKGLIKVLDVGKVCSLVLLQDEFGKKHPKVAEQLMQAIFSAYDYYRLHPEEANAWFMAEAGLPQASAEACNVAASIEPNLSAKKRADIRVTFSEEDYRIMEEAAEFMAPKLKSKVDMRKYVSDSSARNAK